jgi:hypothetical protein
VIALQHWRVLVFSLDSGIYLTLERVLTMDEFAALRCASFAMTIERKARSIERKARSIWQFAKTANCGHDTKL